MPDTVKVTSRGGPGTCGKEGLSGMAPSEPGFAGNVAVGLLADKSPPNSETAYGESNKNSLTMDGITVAVHEQPLGAVTLKLPPPPLIEKLALGGLTEYVQDGAELKPAVSEMGPFIVTVAGLFVPVYEPFPLPDQPLNVKPVLAIAVI
jgi:hypothetical protein